MILKSLIVLILYLISETKRYVWYAKEKLKAFPLTFLTRDVMLRWPSMEREILSRNSNLLPLQQLNFYADLNLNQMQLDPNQG